MLRQHFPDFQPVKLCAVTFDFHCLIPASAVVSVSFDLRKVIDLLYSKTLVLMDYFFKIKIASLLKQRICQLSL